MAAALALPCLVSIALAQSYSTSPLTPALTDPCHTQRFAAPPRNDGTTRAVDSGEPAPPIPPGTGETGFDTTGGIGKKKVARRKSGDPNPARLPPPPPPGPPQQADGHTQAQQIAARAGYAEAYRPPDAPARRRLVPVQDPYEPLGVRVGSFVLRPAIEVTRGYDTNPARVREGKGLAYTEIVPEMQLRSQWSSHEFGANLRGSYIAYDSESSLDRPTVDGKAFSRFDLSRDTKFETEGRLFVATDNPGSPNLQADLAKLPIYVTYGGTAGLTQAFNRLELSVKGIVDRTQYQNSTLTDGTTASNRDRDYIQYGGQARASFEAMPGVKPFIEVGAEQRRHEEAFDRNGFQRDSRALTPKVGTTFELARILTGEFSVGYQMRRYRDPRLEELRGVVADAALAWMPTGLTTVRLTAASRAEETTLANSSGTFRRDAGLQIDHEFRRWLTGTLKFGYGHDRYIGLDRADTRTSLGAALAYKVNRELMVRGEYRYEQLRSNVADADYDANIFLIGLKLQR